MLFLCIPPFGTINKSSFKRLKRKINAIIPQTHLANGQGAGARIARMYNTAQARRRRPLPLAARAAGAGTAGARGAAREGGRQRASVPAPNGLAMQIVYGNTRAQREVRLGDAWRLLPSDELLAALRSEFAASAVEIVFFPCLQKGMAAESGQFKR
jgi:hypothetical protein